MKKIILYGVAIEGEKFYWAYRDCYKIVYCIDRMSHRNFHNIPVYDFVEVAEEIKKRKYLIVIAAGIKAYREISKNLREIGLKEYKDYVASVDVGRWLAVFYGNCHMELLSEYLRNNPTFNRQYIIKYYFCRKEDIPEEILESCKLLVLQDICKGNIGGYVDAESLCNMVDKNCFCIKVPNVYGRNFFFPQFKKTQGLASCGLACQETFEHHVNPNAVIAYEEEKSNVW